MINKIVFVEKRRVVSRHNATLDKIATRLILPAAVMRDALNTTHSPQYIHRV